MKSVVAVSCLALVALVALTAEAEAQSGVRFPGKQDRRPLKLVKLNRANKDANSPAKKSAALIKKAPINKAVVNAAVKKAVALKKSQVAKLQKASESGRDKPVRIGPDGRPLLFGPKIELCKNRKSHGKLGKHHYFLSWRDDWHKFEDWDWFNGRNFCRERCMDLVSFEDPVEFKMFEEVMQQDNITSIYTSGRKCNFKNKGCEQEQFQPINRNGWFWAGAGNTRIPPTNLPSPSTFWSTTGEAKRAQPDNYEGLKAGKLEKVSDPVGLTLEGLQEFHDEACLAVLNNRYNDGVKWHDVACHFRSPLVCEDSPQLLARAIKENPGQTIPDPTPIEQALDAKKA